MRKPIFEPNAAKTTVSLTLNSYLYAKAKSSGINASRSPRSIFFSSGSEAAVHHPHERNATAAAAVMAVSPAGLRSPCGKLMRTL